MDLSNLNWGRFVLAWIAALGVLAIGDMIIHAGSRSSFVVREQSQAAGIVDEDVFGRE